MERKVIVIVGPTASGKTSLSLELAKRLNSEIISADSRQFFKHLDIGTAKPTTEELESINHHLINNLELDDYYNVSKFESDAFKCFENLFNQQLFPIVVGGSGLYIKAIVDGIFDNVDTDPDVREKYLEMRIEKGNDTIYEELKKVDPKSCENLLPQNWKRVLRGLEVYYTTGKPIWQWQQEYVRETNIEFYQYGLDWDREELYKNIENRVDWMIENGLVEETKHVLEMGISKDVNSLNTVGYKEIIEFLEDKITLERAIELIKRNTRRFAKRQLTWFRKDERIKWFSISEPEQIKNIADEILLDHKSL